MDRRSRGATRPRRRARGLGLTRDDEGNPVLHCLGEHKVAVRGHRDLDYREQVLEREGVDVKVVTLTTPGTHVEEPARALELARLVNDDFAAASRKASGRFSALATLPLNDPAAPADELSRAVTELGLPGAMVFANVNGVALADDRFLPLWERADELGAVIHARRERGPVGPGAGRDFLQQRRGAARHLRMLLPSALRGQGRRYIYRLMIPAAIGPEVIAMPEERKAMQMLLATPEG